MFAILIVSVLFGLYMKPWERRAQKVSTTPDDSISSEAAKVSAPVAVADLQFVGEWPDRDPFTRDDEHIGENETATDGFVHTDEPSLVLQGTFTVDGRMACVIDGKTCVIGSEVAGWTLEKIDAQGVWVSQGGERRFVPLP
jgi:hypothetical protein